MGLEREDGGCGKRGRRADERLHGGCAVGVGSRRSEHCLHAYSGGRRLPHAAAVHGCADSICADVERSAISSLQEGMGGDEEPHAWR